MFTIVSIVEVKNKLMLQIFGLKKFFARILLSKDIGFVNTEQLISPSLLIWPNYLTDIQIPK